MTILMGLCTEAQQHRKHTSRWEHKFQYPGTQQVGMGWGQQPTKYSLGNWATDQGWAYNDQDELMYKGQSLEFYEKNEPQLYKTTINKQLKRIADEDAILRYGGQALQDWDTNYPRYQTEKPAGKN